MLGNLRVDSSIERIAEQRDGQLNCIETETLLTQWGLRGGRCCIENHTTCSRICRPYRAIISFALVHFQLSPGTLGPTASSCGESGFEIRPLRLNRS